MENRDLQSWCQQLAEEIAVEVGGKRSKRWRCPKELRSKVVSYVAVCRERGEPYFEIAVRLGLVESTLARWVRIEHSNGKGGFRPVAIVPSGDAESVTQSEAAIRVVTPRGYRIEGLDPQSLAYILRIVG